MPYKATLLTLDALPEAERKLYKPAKIEDAAGKEIDGFAFELEDHDSHPDVGALRRAKRRETLDRQKAEDAAKAAREELRALKEGEHERIKGTRKKEEVDALEKSYAEKLKAKDDENVQLRTSLHKHLVSGVARDLATALAVDVDAVPALIPHILPRLQVEVEGEEARTRVLDPSGKPSAATLEDLKKEMLATKSLARLVSGTKAAGGGAPGSGNTRGGAPSSIDFSQSAEAVGAALEAQAKAAGKL
jgi:hypothetical protein